MFALSYGNSDLNLDQRPRRIYSSYIILRKAKMQFKTRRGLPRNAKLSGDFDEFVNLRGP